ncbi:hypothetical protein HYPDE_28768 [Hyphomicrobium denitrificans 1NES1]|uniref:Uncharacterized protein n=1 Tax=Hyphomicrobium denitrificans 1NES1 TaxID=670307 RepID=N0B367_9HYPH|nr:hypothetical protein HYPDE_28768 [Hyphomicrobium denitrificans 1NES1]
MATGKIGSGAAAMLALLFVNAHTDPYGVDNKRNQTVTVSVNYTFTLPADGGTDAAQNASERGRRQAYDMAGRECANCRRRLPRPAASVASTYRASLNAPTHSNLTA